jgi:hypothetical protein
MFMEVAITAIGIAVVLMIGYLVVAQVRSALPSSTVTSVPNSCYGTWDGINNCTIARCGTSVNSTIYNTSAYVTCADVNVGNGMNSVLTTAYAGFALVAVGIIVLAAFGLITVFRQ